MNYQQSIEYIHSKNKFGIKLGLDTTEALLNRLGNPHKKLKFIHIAGTNGKGSTTSYISDMLIKDGYKVGKYISPYVYSFTERIQINNAEISKEDLAKYTSQVKDALQDSGIEPTEFELVTAIGFLYFYDQGCDYVVLEVGMGGRFDATNVIPPPVLAIITSISLDHTEYLGDTVAKIAFEKCGIIKSGSSVISYANNPAEADEVIKSACEKTGVSLVIPDKSSVKIIKQDIWGTDFLYKEEPYHINMLGKHQVYNAVSAIEASRLIGVSDEAIREGLGTTRFRGRLELLSENPLIIQDGAHNLSGVTELTDALKTYFPDKKVTLVTAMLKDKEYQKCIELLSTVADTFVATETDNPRKTTAEELASAAKGSFSSVYAEPDVNKAIALAKTLTGPNGVICVCGSLYLLGLIDRELL